MKQVRVITIVAGSEEKKKLYSPISIQKQPKRCFNKDRMRVFR